MGFLKQILVTLAVVLLAGLAWIAVDARPGQAIQNSKLPLPGFVRSAVAAISAEPKADKVGATQAPGSAGGRASAIVVAGTVADAETRTRMRAIGSGEAERSVTVYPDVTGIIRVVPFKSGDAVAAGDILSILENDAETVAVERARLALEAAQEKVDRVARLQASRAVTNVEVTDATRERENARLDLRAAEIALDKRTIRAPIPGRVGIVGVDTGDLVTGQTVIATIDDRARLKVNFYTPEAFVQELSIGAEIDAQSVARPDRSYKGRITALESRLDEASRTLRTEATIDNPNDQLRPGMSFTISLALAGESFLAVDPMAVVWERTGPIVWKIQGTDVAKTPVRIVERTIDKVLVSSDVLKAGDEVVIEGLQSVREGGKIEVQNRVAPAPLPTADAGTAAPAEIAQGAGTSGTAAR
ncbi:MULTISPECIES: efflux RND transporter periplasmic adaptor subunit [unclassified Aureimonas]|uniref:efflux RND transporter periplasmic adaptor subunit n=1 Tax=unclassified Aureimonas TaxID=2615206 RepID=UPI0006F8D85F|nr:MULTISPECIES: efflux RND transporter periplasmic adaptor subunit [unclassified Aureimonas]KQT66104.1 RND transporter [Aureimonas sp. Leaf427]KQT81032.1 RND transporter [Aureimonas sp. Leaf460]